MKTKSNYMWSLIIAFILMFVLFSFISFKLFSVQYSDTSITITHNPKFRTVEATRGNIISEDGRILSVTMPVYDVRLDLFTVNNSLFEKEVEKIVVKEVIKEIPIYKEKIIEKVIEIENTELIE